MGIGQTEETKKVYRPDQSDQNRVICQTKQTKIWLLTTTNRPIYGSWPDRTDRYMGFIQTEQIELRVLARPTTTKYGR